MAPDDFDHETPAMKPLSRHAALLLFAVVVAVWGSNWTVTKIVVETVSPLWGSAIRSAIASVALLALLLIRGQLALPRRGDLPVIFTVAILHMGAFAVLVAFGLQLVPVGRSIVLGYTTPLWVAPAAWLLLREPVTRSRLAGVGLGLAGLAIMFNPLAFDWSDGHALIGNGMLLLGALCWAANILYVRAHRWISTPFQLVFWQALLATAVLSALALVVDGVPRIDWTALTAALLYGGICGTALAHWAMVMVNRDLPAVTTSLGLLATPLLGIFSAAAILGEPLEPSLFLAMAPDHRRHRAWHRLRRFTARAKTHLVRHEIPVLVVAHDLARRFVVEFEEVFGIAARRHVQEAGEIMLQAARGQEQHIGAAAGLVDDDVVTAGGHVGLLVAQRDHVFVVVDIGLEFTRLDAGHDPFAVGAVPLEVLLQGDLVQRGVLEKRQRGRANQERDREFHAVPAGPATRVSPSRTAAEEQ